VKKTAIAAWQMCTDLRVRDGLSLSVSLLGVLGTLKLLDKVGRGEQLKKSIVCMKIYILWAFHRLVVNVNVFTFEVWSEICDVSSVILQSIKFT
jgi:hypothetical protein